MLIVVLKSDFQSYFYFFIFILEIKIVIQNMIEQWILKIWTFKHVWISLKYFFIFFLGKNPPLFGAKLKKSHFGPFGHFGLFWPISPQKQNNSSSFGSTFGSLLDPLLGQFRVHFGTQNVFIPGLLLGPFRGQE